MPNQPKYPPSQVVINPVLKKEVQEIAKRLGMSWSAVIEEALNDWINNLR